MVTIADNRGRGSGLSKSGIAVRLMGIDHHVFKEVAMFSRLSAAPAAGKWCAYLLLLLVPGSFFVLPAVWLVRFVRRPLPATGAGQPTVSAARA